MQPIDGSQTLKERIHIDDVVQVHQHTSVDQFKIFRFTMFCDAATFPVSEDALASQNEVWKDMHEVSTFNCE